MKIFLHFSVLAIFATGFATAQNTILTDDFSTDTSSNYGGASFSIAGGTLNVPINSPTATSILTNTKVAFPVGATVALDAVNARNNFELDGLIIATDAGSIDRLIVARSTFDGGSSHGYSFIFNGGFTRAVGTNEPCTFFITRCSADTFRIGARVNGNTVASFTQIESAWANETEFFVGTRQLRDTGSGSLSYDNLRVTQIPQSPICILPAHIIRFETVAGITYSLQVSTDCENFTDSDQSVVGDGNEMEFCIERTNPREFYRVVP